MNNIQLVFKSNKNQFNILFPNCWNNKKEEFKLKIIKRLFNQLDLEDDNLSFLVNDSKDFNHDFVLDSNGFIKKNKSPYLKIHNIKI